MRIAALHFYPVKSCAGVALREARLGPLGLESDRRYVLLTASGRALTQRDVPPLATIRPQLSAGGLALDLGGLARVEAAAAEFSAHCEAEVWGRKLPALAAGDSVNRPLSDYVGVTVRLVALGAEAARSFADSKPVLVVSTSSLEALNARLAQPVGLERFRGNVVIEGAEPLAELGWRRLAAGEAELEFAEACERCEVTTIDQASGTRRGEEPLQTLAARFNSVFGARYRILRPGRIAVGDEVVAA